MSNYNIKYSKEFKKSFKKLIKQGKNIDKLLDVVEMLSRKEQLDPKYKDHALYNDKRFKVAEIAILNQIGYLFTNIWIMN